MQLGLYTFGDIAPNQSPQQRMTDLLEEIVLADEVGLDVFGVGEHHRPDYVVSAPAVVLGAAASRTRRIRLSSAVTVLSSEDPVRVFQQFVTVDLLSGGRAEIMAGRGSFIESFPLFGYDLEKYDALFSEKINLLLRLRESTNVSWKGTLTADIPNRGVYPRPAQNELPVWIAVGGTPESVVRAGEYGLPLAIAIIGGQPAHFVPLVKLYRQTWDEAKHNAEDLQLGINSHCFVAPTTQEARDLFWPPYAAIMTRIGRERGWPPMTRGQFDAACGPKGALLVGSPQEVADKIMYQKELFANTRFLAQMSMGVPHKALLRSIELFGTTVAPLVRQA